MSVSTGFFLISDKKYAVRSSEVLEIISDVSVYKLPFMPNFIEGLTNEETNSFIEKHLKECE